MNVVIEFESAGAQQWSGRLHGDSPATADLHFEGRLDLLRLLETVVASGSADQSGGAR